MLSEKVRNYKKAIFLIIFFSHCLNRMQPKQLKRFFTQLLLMVKLNILKLLK